jgi:signal transduction histidine kinase
MMDDQVSNVGDPGEGVGQDEDGILAIEQGVRQEQTGSGEAEPPEGGGDHDLSAAFRGVPLDDEPGKEDPVAGHADDFPQVPLNAEEVSVDEEECSEPFHRKGRLSLGCARETNEKGEMSFTGWVPRGHNMRGENELRMRMPRIMSRLRNFSFRWKLTLIVMLSCVVSLVAACSAFVGFDLYFFRQAAVKELQSTARLLSAANSVSLESGDHGAVQLSLAALRTQEQIVAVAVYDVENRVVAAHRQVGMDEPIPERPDAVDSRFRGDSLTFYSPVMVGERRIGTVYLKADLRGTVRERLATYLQIVAMVMLISGVIALAISAGLQPLIVRPIMELLRVARLVTEKQDFVVRAEKTTDDEVGRLVDSFNGMLAMIQSRDAELQSANDLLEAYNLDLEKKVNERTAALERASAEAQAAKQVAEESQQSAEEASRAKSVFLANMSHELRTPLNAIIGYSEMLEEDANDAGLTDFVADLRKIHGAGKHLLGLINDVLDISKIEAGKMDLFLETFAVETLVQDVVSTIKPLVQQNGNTLQVELGADWGR